MHEAHVSTGDRKKDWARSPGWIFLWWILPIVGATAADIFLSLLLHVALAWAAAFIWMGMGCLLNARRCHRLHCYMAAPIFFIGAVCVGLVGFGVISFGPQSLSIVIWSTIGLALLSFVPEVILRRRV